MAVEISLEKLLEAGAHFGHQRRRWNPKMEQFLFGMKEGIFVFDLVQTQKCLELALNEVTKAAAEDKIILLVGTKKQAKEKVAEVGKATGFPYVDERWLGGTLTNFSQMRSTVKNLENLRKRRLDANKIGFTKKEKLLLDRKIEKFDKSFGGIIKQEQLPDLLFIIDAGREKGAVAEAKRLNIPVIAVVDSNTDPSFIDFPIPMNDDAKKAVGYVLDLFVEAVEEAKTAPKKATTKAAPKAKTKTKTKTKEK